MTLQKVSEKESVVWRGESTICTLKPCSPHVPTSQAIVVMWSAGWPVQINTKRESCGLLKILPWPHFHCLPLLQISLLSACWGKRRPFLQYQLEAAMSCRFLRDWHRDNPDPSTVASSSNTIYSWICHLCAHVWNTSPNSREMNSTDCPQCLQKRQRTAKLPLFVEAHPELAAEWVPHPDFKPINSLTIGSNEMEKWQCPLCQGIYATSVKRRVLGKGCPNSSCCTARRLSSEVLQRRKLIQDLRYGRTGQSFWVPLMPMSLSTTDIGIQRSQLQSCSNYSWQCFMKRDWVCTSVWHKYHYDSIAQISLSVWWCIHLHTTRYWSVKFNNDCFACMN